VTVRDISCIDCRCYDAFGTPPNRVSICTLTNQFTGKNQSHCTQFVRRGKLSPGMGKLSATSQKQASSQDPQELDNHAQGGENLKC